MRDRISTKKSMTDYPLVAIWMLTFNHENFIKQSIETVLMQKTNFKYRLYIGEDCSTDKTRQICIEYANKNPEKIHLFLNERNDIKKNAYTIYNYCFNSGAKYIALLDGDDYWTDPFKLQKQVDFLEVNPEFVLCFHKVKILKDDQLIDDFITNVPGEITTINDLASENYIYPLATVFRNIFQGGLPKWFYECSVGDYPLFMLLASHGKIKSLNDYMGVYRLNNDGIWFSKRDLHKNREWHKMLVYLSGDMESEIKRKIQEKIIYFYSCLDKKYEEMGNSLLIAQNNLQNVQKSIDFKVGTMFLKVPRLIKKIFCI